MSPTNHKFFLCVTHQLTTSSQTHLRNTHWVQSSLTQNSALCNGHVFVLS